MKAVKVSLFVGLSAFFRVFFAQQILDMFDVSQCIAFALIALFVYVVDRSFDYNSRRSLVFAFAIFVVAVLLSNFVYAPFIALAVGFMYSKGVNGFRLMGYGIKNAVTGLTWGIIISLYSQVTLFIVAFFTIKSAIITILNDFKDVDDDFKKGIKTIPIIFKEKTTYILLALHFAFHAAIYVHELLPVPVLLFSLLVGTITIWKIKPKVAQAEFIVQPLLIALNSI